MSGTETLREDHRQVRRLEEVVRRCHTRLEQGKDVPLGDIESITVIISEFLDAIHYGREEDSYFACVASYGGLNEEIRKFMIEHEFGRRVARNIAKHLREWQAGKDAREPVARFLRTYRVYLGDHLGKEDAFFDEAEDVLSKEEEAEMHRQFRSVMTETKTVQEMVEKIEQLEATAWYAGRL